VNDGTALVVYGLAVGVTVGQERVSVGHVSWLFALAYLGGALAGLVAAGLVMLTRRYLHDPLLENLVSVLTPFVAFLLAQLVHASGVLAVVVCGLVLSQVGPRVVRAETRQQGEAFWVLATFLLNSSLFVLVGLQAHAAVRQLTTVSLGRALIAVGLISATVVATRIGWSFTTTYLIRAIDRRPRQRERRVGARVRMVNALAGFRGAVSLAAALAVPKTVHSGGPFPDRDVIIFVTSGVIVVTMVLQSLALPAVIRWAHLPPDTAVDDERRMAETRASEEALAAVADIAARLGTDEAVVQRTTTEYEKHLHLIHSRAEQSDVDDPVRRYDEQYATLRLELLAHKRATVVRLRDDRLIDDTVLRQVQERLDIEEVRLSRRMVAD
jgi:CPA1 family monovalent cation:H+ antiporter